MASSSSSTPKPMPADDIFSDRVNKTFASPFLASLQPLTSPSPSLWSPAAAVQKKEWRRDTDTSTPCSSSFHGFFSHSRNHRQAQNDAVHLGIDDSDVRSTIGLDPTLDNEEEEDTFDKVAIGRENAGDLLYMADVVDHHDVDFRSEDDTLGVVRNRQRDPRANLRAAKIRLNEDDMQTSVQRDQPRPDQKNPPHADEKKSSTTGGDGHNLKSILKRKEHEITTRASKRVRFDPECLSASQTVGEVSGGIAPRGIVLKIDNDQSREDENVSRVPDYVQNPSKYTRYSLDSVDEMSDKSNSGAFFDYLKMMKKAENGVIVSEEIEALPVKLPKSVTFVPKKRSQTFVPEKTFASLFLEKFLGTPLLSDIKSEDDMLGMVRNRQRDPRANLRAAKIRLNEDDMETAVQRDQPRPDQKTPPHADEKKSSTAGGDGHNLKSILKRKEHEITTRASKRVRFDPECLSASQTVGEVSGGIAPRGIVLKIDNDRSREDENVSRVPDYVQNPSKYTRCSPDSVDKMSDKSNSGAFFDYPKMMKKAKNGVIVSEEIDGLPVKLPKSVTFVPKKRSQTFVPEKTFASLFLEKFLGTTLLSDIKSEDDMLGMVRNRQRDPRANLRAAKIRLNEDDMETAVQRDQPRPDQKTPPHADEKKSSTAGGDGHNLKSTLKRKEHEITTRASKRVWFDPECLSASQTVGEVSGGIAPRGIVLKIDNDRTREDENVSRVPDYVQNPSKYTRYSLGSVDEMSDKSNSGAFFDYLEIMKKAKNGVIVSDEINALPVKLPKSVTFVPKKKSDIADKSDDCHSKTPQDRQSDGKSFSIQPNLLGLAAEEHQETGVDDMDSDEPKGSVVTDVGTTFKKHGR